MASLQFIERLVWSRRGLENVLRENCNNFYFAFLSWTFAILPGVLRLPNKLPVDVRAAYRSGSSCRLAGHAVDYTALPLAALPMSS